MRKVKTFEDFFEIYDDGILTARLPLTTDQYSTVELHISSLEPPADKVVPGNVPQEVTMRQARLACLQFGILEQLNALVAAMTGVEGKAARIEWEYASTIKRTSPLALAMISQAGVTEEQLDQMFILANTFD